LHLAAEILGSGYFNTSDDIFDQTIYAIRILSSKYFTFYKAEIPGKYWFEIAGGLPKEQLIKIVRWPKENTLESGLNLVNPKERREILEILVKLRQRFKATKNK